jgi:predicted Rossmann fold flavoprotein
MNKSYNKDSKMPQQNYDIIIIGAGAAGLIAAGTSARKGKSVLLLEKMRSQGRKMLISGKGRCNITNDSYASHHFKKIHPNAKFLKHAYKKFFKDDILEILSQQNVEYKTERGQRVFPASDKSKDVVNGISNWALTKNVTFETHAEVTEILLQNGEITGVEYKQLGIKKHAATSKVIIATGGKSYPATGSTGDGYILAKKLGHSIVKPLPALTPLITKGNLATSLMGLSLKNVTACLWLDGRKQQEEFGEMLFTHYGLSGPIILTISRQAVIALDANKKVEISIDLKPALDIDKLDARLLRDIQEHGKKNIENLFKLWLPSKMIKPMIDLCEIPKDKRGFDINAQERKHIRNYLKELKFKVVSSRAFKEAIITQGGVSLEEVDSKTLESKIVKGLFFAGEVLNLDADTGGYNFQIAYSTGHLAGSVG